MPSQREILEPVEITYVCSACKAEDHDRGSNPPAPKILNCFSCHAGYNVPIQEMAARRLGMFPRLAT